MLRGLKERYPLLWNLRVGQVLYGVVATLIGLGLWRHYAGVAPLDTFGLLVRWLGLAVVTLVFGIALQNTFRYALAPDYSLLCRYCNGPVNRYSEFCEHCGGDLIAEEKLVKCPGCDLELYEGTKHCPECGSSIKPKGSKREQKAQAKAKAKGPASPVDTREAGWSTPIDAVSGFPPDDERR